MGVEHAQYEPMYECVYEVGIGNRGCCFIH